MTSFRLHPNFHQIPSSARIIFTIFSLALLSEQCTSRPLLGGVRGGGGGRRGGILVHHVRMNRKASVRTGQLVGRWQRAALMIACGKRKKGEWLLPIMDSFFPTNPVSFVTH